MNYSPIEAYEIYLNNPISVYDILGVLYEPHTMIGDADVSALTPDQFAQLWGHEIFLSVAEAWEARKNEEEPFNPETEE